MWLIYFGSLNLLSPCLDLRSSKPHDILEQKKLFRNCRKQSGRVALLAFSENELTSQFNHCWELRSPTRETKGIWSQLQTTGFAFHLATQYLLCSILSITNLCLTIKSLTGEWNRHSIKQSPCYCTHSEWYLGCILLKYWHLNPYVGCGTRGLTRKRWIQTTTGLSLHKTNHWISTTELLTDYIYLYKMLRYVQLCQLQYAADLKLFRSWFLA